MKARKLNKRGQLNVPDGYELVINGKITLEEKPNCIIICPKDSGKYKTWQPSDYTYLVKDGKMVNDINLEPYVPTWYLARKI